MSRVVMGRVGNGMRSGFSLVGGGSGMNGLSGGEYLGIGVCLGGRKGRRGI